MPERGPTVGAEPAYSTSGGGFRSANRPEPPARGDAGGGRGAPQPGGSSGGGGGGPRMPRGGGGASAPRPERYWTDYLRIVLPIIGLLLMLSVFIFWVGNIIDANGDDGDTNPTEVSLGVTAAPSEGAAGAPTVPPSPAESVAPASDPAAAESPAEAASEEPAGEATEEPTIAPDDAASEPPADEEAVEEPTEELAPEDQATEEAPADGEFAAGDAVITDGELRLREEATAEGGEATIIETLQSGTELSIVSGPVNDGAMDWYEVETPEGVMGFVAADFITAAPAA